MDLIDLPAATLWMGSTANEVQACVKYWRGKLVDGAYKPKEFERWISKEYPKHAVELCPFSIGRFPVTNGEYSAFLDAIGGEQPESIRSEEPRNHPVWGVTFEQALAYAAWLGGVLGKTCRLPHEAEWEYAARGSSGREYPFGQTFDPGLCNTIESGIGHTTPVDAYPKGTSEFGVFDLAGNVEEWTMDFYAPYPGGVLVEDELVRALGPYRVLRGGSFSRGGDLARCARRHGPLPSLEFRFIGFRVAISLDS